MAHKDFRCGAAKSDTLVGIADMRRPGGGSGTRAYDPEPALHPHWRTLVFEVLRVSGGPRPRAAAGTASFFLNPRWHKILPRPDPTMPAIAATLYCICGKIAAGKTSLARKLAAEHAAVLICEDEWLVRIEAEIETFDDFRKHARRLFRAVIGPHVIGLLRMGVSVVLDIRRRRFLIR
jgi:hypothetical protein